MQRSTVAGLCPYGIQASQSATLMYRRLDTINPRDIRTLQYRVQLRDFAVVQPRDTSLLKYGSFQLSSDSETPRFSRASLGALQLLLRYRIPIRQHSGQPEIFGTSFHLSRYYHNQFVFAYITPNERLPPNFSSTRRPTESRSAPLPRSAAQPRRPLDNAI